MIKIERCECPDILEDHPVEGNRYRNEKVVQKLWEMQHGKCCYCEQKIPPKGHSKAVEHFKPKSVFKYLRNDWKNLLLVCPQCNGTKLDKFPVKLTDEIGEPKVVYLRVESGAEPLIIDPSNSDIDPENHIDFIVDDMKEAYGVIIAKNNCELGCVTIDVIGLYQKFYIDKRKRHIHNLMGDYENLLRAKHLNDISMLERYIDKFKMLMSAKEEFAALARAYARHKKLDQRFGIRIPIEAET